MILPFGLCPWPACLISEQPPHCMGSHWSMQWLWFLLLPLKRSCIPNYDQHHFPCLLLKYLSLHCSSTLLSFTPGVRQWFLTVLCRDVASREAVQSQISFIPTSLVARVCQTFCSHFGMPGYLATFPAWLPDINGAHSGYSESSATYSSMN